MTAKEMTFDWIEASVQVDGEAAEAVSELINRYVPAGAVIEQDPCAPDRLTVKVFLPPDADQTRQKIAEGLWHLGQIYPIPEPRFRLLPYREWAEAWKEHFAVLHLGRRLVVKPSWLTYSAAPGEVVVELDPGMAFGTGLHPSTRLCIQALEDLIEPGARVLDLGTGSGILAISAVLLGAAQVTALDVDELAVRAAAANAAANSVADRLQIEYGSIERLLAGPPTFDLLLVNIEVHVIHQLIVRGVLSHLKPGGWFVGAGILENQTDDILALLAEKRLRDIKVRRQEDWVAIVGQMA